MLEPVNDTPWIKKMQVQLEESENGLTLPIPEEVAQSSQMQPGSLVDLSLIDGKILVSPVRRSKYTIEELMAGVTNENVREAVDFGPPVGKEI